MWSIYCIGRGLTCLYERRERRPGVCSHTPQAQNYKYANEAAKPLKHVNTGLSTCNIIYVHHMTKYFAQCYATGVTQHTLTREKNKRGTEHRDETLEDCPSTNMARICDVVASSEAYASPLSQICLHVWWGM